MDFSKAPGRLEWWKRSGVWLRYGAGEKRAGNRSGGDEVIILQQDRIAPKIP